MLRQFRPLLMRCALACLVGVSAAPAMAAGGGGVHAGPRVVMSPSYVRNAVPGRFGVRRQVIRPEQTVRPGQIARPGQFDGRLGQRRFRSRFPWVGGAGVAGEVPVPVGSDAGEPIPANSPAMDNDAGFGAYPQAPVGPQIIILPDAPTKRGGNLRRSAVRHDLLVPSPWRAATMPVFPRRRALARHRATPWLDVAGPSYDEAPSSIALAPCPDSPHTPIYNTPCGVRPYE
jgi:hypothetical protein